MKCEKGLSFEDCELLILRQAIDKAEKRKGRKMINDPLIKEIISIVEKFIIDNQLICYGGTAINNILPIKDQFYDKSSELPDYDFFSPDPLQHAKDLADIYYAAGFNDVEAKAGMHEGTFKVYVNFIPVADITYIVPELYKSLKKKALKVDNILYTPPDYLRMLMYLELSRPSGDPSRWEKVLKRLILLNKNYPLKGKYCNFVEIQRKFDTSKKFTKFDQKKIFYITRNSFIDQNLVFFGAMANELYLKELHMFKPLAFIPDFDVLSENPKKSATILKEHLEKVGLENVTINERKGVGEVIAPHYEVKIGNETIAFIYKPIGCHSYNVINYNGTKVRIATIDTMLSFYLAFTYVDRPYYDVNRLLCMAQFLFTVQQKNRLEQKGVLRRFSINCFGKQKTLEEIRKEKHEKYKKLEGKKGTKEWDKYFLRYIPGFYKKKKKKENKKENKGGIAAKTRKKSYRKKKRRKTYKKNNKK